MAEKTDIPEITLRQIMGIKLTEKESKEGARLIVAFECSANPVALAQISDWRRQHAVMDVKVSTRVKPRYQLRFEQLDTKTGETVAISSDSFGWRE